MAETISTGGAPPVQTHTLPVAHRIELGRELRKRCDRRSHAAWERPPAAAIPSTS
jgi:hypothetical protein